MALYFVLANVLFWIVYYIFEGRHDGYVINEKEYLRVGSNYYRSLLDVNKIKYDVIREDILSNYSKGWHTEDTYEKAITKVYIGLLGGLFYYYGIGNTHIGDAIIFSGLNILNSVTIRVMVHDAVINLRIFKGIDYVGVTNTNFWDIFLRKMRDKGVNPNLIRISFFVISLVLTLWYVL